MKIILIILILATIVSAETPNTKAVMLSGTWLSKADVCGASDITFTEKIDDSWFYGTQPAYFKLFTTNRVEGFFKVDKGRVKLSGKEINEALKNIYKYQEENCR